MVEVWTLSGVPFVIESFTAGAKPYAMLLSLFPSFHDFVLCAQPLS